MRQPNAKSAVVEQRKLRDYVLSSSHPVGHFKAAFFASIGFTQANLEEFRSQLLRIAAQSAVADTVDSQFGRKYLLHGIVTGPTGASAEVTTIWILATGSDIPRLVTVYPR